MDLLIYDRNALIVIGGGSDSPWVFVPGKGWRKGPGWEVSRFDDLISATSALKEAAKFKNPRLIERVGNQLGEFVHEELTEYLSEAGQREGS